MQAYDIYRAVLTGKPYPLKGLVMFGGNLLLSNGDTRQGRAALQALVQSAGEIRTGGTRVDASWNGVWRGNRYVTQLRIGDATVAAFAVWEGGHREVGARKAWSAWVPLTIGAVPLANIAFGIGWSPLLVGVGGLAGVRTGVALVIGGSGGIGGQIAKGFAADKAYTNGLVDNVNLFNGNLARHALALFILTGDCGLLIFLSRDKAS